MLKKTLGIVCLVFVAFTTTIAQDISKRSFELRNGDLLFQDLDCGPMCDAIEEVTILYE